ncbi:MAG: hypothetical protein JNL96_06935 [Planctomycetaceae bacterium]|nr:hypothetical protein [Planctomycetaceae bacterium]
MLAQIGLGVDLGGLILFLLVANLGLLSSGLGCVFVVLGVRARRLRVPASRHFRIAGVLVVVGLACFALALAIRSGNLR